MSTRILLVDDDPDALRLVSYTLQAKGYEVVQAATAVEALAVAAASDIDVVILDVMVPDMSGFEVCQRLRADPRTAQRPILMLSGKGTVQDRVAGLKAGADDYLAKPADMDELIARVETLLLRASRATTAAPEAQMLAFVGAKGGVGTTTVAVNLALALAQGGKSTILVDLHPYMGCVRPMLGLHAGLGLSDLAQNETRTIRSRDIANRLSAHSNGLRVLAGDDELSSGNARELTAADADALVDALSTMADWVVFDIPGWPAAASQGVLQRCDFVALVTEPDPISLRCAKGQLELLRHNGVKPEVVSIIIVNHLLSQMAKTVDELQQMLGAPIVGIVPPAPDACLGALNQSQPLLLAAPDHSASLTLKALAKQLL